MSVTVQPRNGKATVAGTRAIAAAIGAVVVLDVVWVRAPFLLILGLPFIATAWRYRGRHLAANVGLILWCLVYVAVGVSFALSNGLQAPAEPGDVTRSAINVGDFAAVYIGTPLAGWLGVRAAKSLLRHGRAASAVAL